MLFNLEIIRWKNSENNSAGKVLNRKEITVHKLRPHISLASSETIHYLHCIMGYTGTRMDLIVLGLELFGFLTRDNQTYICVGLQCTVHVVQLIIGWKNSENNNAGKLLLGWKRKFLSNYFLVKQHVIVLLLLGGGGIHWALRGEGRGGVAGGQYKMHSKTVVFYEAKCFTKRLETSKFHDSLIFFTFFNDFHWRSYSWEVWIAQKAAE